MRPTKPSEYFPLVGKEQEILVKREAGKTEYQLALEYSVYPNAIRQAVIRARREREAVGK